MSNDALEQLTQRCYLLFGTPSARTFCISACRSESVVPFKSEIVPVWYCVEHAHLWPSLDGSAHDATVLRLAARHFSINLDEGRPPCHVNCCAKSLSHELVNRGLWHPPDVSIHWCPTHRYLHVCRGSETPCGECMACAAGTWCVYRCRGELYGSHGEPACPWSGRILSNIEAPYTKPLKKEKAITPKPTDSTNEKMKAARPPQHKQSGNATTTYINGWLSEATQQMLAAKGEVNSAPREKVQAYDHRNVEELVGSWATVSADWPSELHIAGWVFLLSKQNNAPFPLRVQESRRAFIDAMAETQYKRLRASNAADAIVCHMLQHPIPPSILNQIKKNNSLFDS